MGPLQGYTVIEMAGLGPAPMAGMLLADMGARVIRVERSTRLPEDQLKDVSFRGKQSIALDLKKPAGVEALLKLLESADALIEGYRPGVAERLGIGPDVVLKRNPKLVYGRMTGWGQDGPLSQTAGHDINYIAISGVLHAIGRRGERPVAPINLVGDMGGGGMLLGFGVVCALLEAQRSGKGQVVDAAMVDGAAQLMWMMHGFYAGGFWNAKERGANLLDGGAHFYDTYETADGRYVAVGAIEPQFYARLLELTGADPAEFADQRNESAWPRMKDSLAAIFKTRTRDEWARITEGSDACVAPVLDMLEAPSHPHNAARKTFIDIDGVMQAAPAPRYSRTVPEVRHGNRPAGADGAAVFAAAGFTADQIAQLRRDAVLLQNDQESQ
ncbi:MAG: carnitine dehydratase [Hydrocarboniphaga sp.]|uniref:CaiB/BaiF CoA transferase family protein n=1 Tax=Hydrocarboniphaga sp. TaxID=2033016 RepID=UPI002611B25D|nr:CaiB/BaiF CoA-transferase family protein [Hydrocarboniphaga sp.]MDB5969960.1 carnitine dehydratase [Hydrocarboniphaga sp.]